LTGVKLWKLYWLMERLLERVKAISPRIDQLSILI
jgi:hypothetical protein